MDSSPGSATNSLCDPGQGPFSFLSLSFLIFKTGAKGKLEELVSKVSSRYKLIHLV